LRCPKTIILNTIIKTQGTQRKDTEGKRDVRHSAENSCPVSSDWGTECTVSVYPQDISGGFVSYRVPGSFFSVPLCENPVFSVVIKINRSDPLPVIS
jgi:hypothetical protein